MAELNFATATSVLVERVFSQGQILLSHIQNHLSPQTACALMYLEDRSQLGLVKDSNVLAVIALPDVDMIDGNDKNDIELDDKWYSIIL